MPPKAAIDSRRRRILGLPVGDGLPESVDGRYRVLRCLGEGAFATVLLCSDEKKRGRLVAIKGVRSISPAEQHFLMHEFVNARRLRHPNLVSVLEIAVSPLHGVYLVLEYVNGPDLVTLIESEGLFPLDVAAEVCRQVARALAHMHKRGLIHRDIKADNVYVEGARAKLGDFGASRASCPKGTATVIFTPGYAPPEATLGIVGPQTDTFALGALFHVLVAGETPPQRSSRMRHSLLSASFSARSGGRAAQLARRLLHPRREMRLTDLCTIHARFKALTKANSRKRLRAMVERAVQKRERERIEERWLEFEQRFGLAFKPFKLEWVCCECGGPASEGMLFCAWCGELLRFRSDATFPRYCGRCEHGLHDEWAHCPWCGEHYEANIQRSRRSADRRYEDHCGECGGKMMRYMSFCPWCGRSYTWHARGMSGRCGACDYSVEQGLFGFCPWCGDLLNQVLARQASERVASRR